MKRTLFIAGAVSALCFATIASAEEAGVFSDLGFEAACAKAKEADRIVMVDFFTTWCVPCKKLDQVTWPDEKVMAWLREKAIALKIDAEKEEALAKKYHVRSYPTVLLLRADGTEIDRLTGYKSPEEFLKIAAELLAGQGAVLRARAKLVGHHALDPHLREEYADALALSGNNEEALKEYVWCYDHGLEHRRSFANARSSSLLSGMAHLGTEYPPAMEALRTRRDACAAKLLADQGSVDDAGDLAGLNKVLNDAANSLEVYDKLAKLAETNDLRDVLFESVFDHLLEARRYGDIAAHARDAMDELFETQEMAAADAARENSEEATEFAVYMIEEVVERGGAYYEALLGNGGKGAEELAGRILKLSPAGSTWAGLIGHAVRAGANDAARRLSEEGLKVKAGADAEAIREAAGKIPGK